MRAVLIGMFLAGFCWPIANATGAVIVVANRAKIEVPFTFSPEGSSKSQPRPFTLVSGEVLPIVVDRPGQIVFASADEKKTFRVIPHGMYYFGEPQPGRLELSQIGLSTPPIALHGQAVDVESLSVAAPVSLAAPSLVIPIKILYDHVEVSTPEAWERRIRARFDKANAILKKHCFVEFHIVAIESWPSDGALDTLDKLLGEFERQVDSAPARVAIGFTGRHRPDYRDPHMGGTRGPLHPHLLIREHVNRNSEAERLEILVHELGHYLGAVHSPESNSVMRPVFGDRQARHTKFRIVFDPLNTLAMCLVSQELASKPHSFLIDMQPFTRVELLRVYTDLARAIPNDPTALRYLNRLGLELRQVPATEPAR